MSITTHIALSSLFACQWLIKAQSDSQETYVKGLDGGRSQRGSMRDLLDRADRIEGNGLQSDIKVSRVLKQDDVDSAYYMVKIVCYRNVGCRIALLLVSIFL